MAGKAIKIAVGQLTSTANITQNLAAVERLMSAAAALDCMLLSLPEAFDYICATPTEAQAAAEPLDGCLFTAYRTMARKHRLFVAFGGFHESASPRNTVAEKPYDGRIANAHVLVDPTGAIVARYSKTHLFDVSTVDGVFRESDFTRPGDHLVAVANLPFGMLGLSTCYDLRFPMVYQALRAVGCNLMLVPSAFMPRWA